MRPSGRVGIRGKGGPVEAKDRMTAEEFAEFAYMNVQTVRRKCRSGEIPAVKPGSRYVVLVDEYLAEQKKLRDAR